MPYLSPVFDMEFMLAYTDYNFVPKINSAKSALIEDYKKHHKMVKKSRKISGYYFS
jgi:hypothetical protein